MAMNLDAYFEDFTARDWQTTDDVRLRFALVGLGQFVRRNVLPAMAETDFCEVTTLVSGSPEKARRLADEYGADHVIGYDAFERGEATDAYDAVYVGGPNALHLDYARAAADHGKHVLCEKPIETSADRAREMTEVCESAGVTLMVAYRPRVEPGMRRLQEMIHDGVLGDPVQIHAWFTGIVLGYDPDPDQWRLDPDLAGGGAMVDVGVYPLNASRHLLDSDPVAAQATTSAPDPAFDRVEEHVAFQLEFPGSVTASCGASYRAHFDDRLTIVGTDGRASIDPAFDAERNPTLTVEVGSERFEFEGKFVNEVAEEFDYFAHCAATDTTPEPDGWDSVADMETVEAIYESAETGQSVEVRIEDR
ncbi:D-xylose 1-dehydrogenase Gfo6 [Halorussus amylolyticus]|uniref:D-xylose 1-dehydrogenase Gfo6 n=1 Tax=Halorussus amylolyticus TaxID=1126242 RepID=UPI001EE48E65|nr:D-xylose 1-dehydrogenase Gfo6 [Halorussus amylolyticus]